MSKQKELKLLKQHLFKSQAKRLLKMFSCGSVLMLGTSLGGTGYIFQKMDSYNPEKFPDEKIVLNGYVVPRERFYRNLFERDGNWYYLDHKGKEVNLNQASDYRYEGDERHRSVQNVSVSLALDTVEIVRNGKSKALTYSFAAGDTVPSFPTLGFYNWDSIHVRYFWSKDASLQNLYQPYNDEENCTFDHEYQHFLNAKNGILKSGQSYGRIFSFMCMDEVSANIAQLCAQREKYIRTKDINKIASRYKFYREWVLLHPEIQPHQLSEEEVRVIAAGIFDEWKRDKFSLYEGRNVTRAKYMLSKADYNGCVNHDREGREVMQAVFHINGYDFYQYIRGREIEFEDMLSPKYKEEFAKLTAAKREKMRYMERVGQYTNNDTKAKDEYFRGIKNKYIWNRFRKNLGI